MGEIDSFILGALCGVIVGAISATSVIFSYQSSDLLCIKNEGSSDMNVEVKQALKTVLDAIDDSRGAGSFWHDEFANHRNGREDRDTRSMNMELNHIIEDAVEVLRKEIQ